MLLCANDLIRRENPWLGSTGDLSGAANRDAESDSENEEGKIVDKDLILLTLGDSFGEYSLLGETVLLMFRQGRCLCMCLLVVQLVIQVRRTRTFALTQSRTQHTHGSLLTACSHKHTNQDWGASFPGFSVNITAVTALMCMVLTRENFMEVVSSYPGFIQVSLFFLLHSSVFQVSRFLPFARSVELQHL